ncbi:MAG: MMPL family transporter, partial [Gemmatimonadetes bacterium]|nr:MMPL family transporter [Gemmatimonadota bacterium]
FIEGVDRARVQSLWTPNTRYTEVVEGGIEAGDVIPPDFQPDAEGLARVRENILKAGIVGRLVANDFSGAMVSAQLLDADPETGRPIDYIAISQELEENVRARIENDKFAVSVDTPVSVHMIGFAKVVGDVAEGALSVVTFAIVTVALTLLFVWIYVQSLRIALVPVISSLVAMVWMLGLLVILGYGVDPLGILVPFIIFAIGTSHGVQKISAVSDAALAGADCNEAARRTFRLLFLPAIVALLANLVGFVTILLIPVQVIREMAVTASLGIAVVILTDLILLPVLVSYVPLSQRFRDRVARRQQLLQKLWNRLARITDRGPAAVIIAIAIALGVLGFIKGRETPIGDTQAGVPELRADSRYNRDSNLISNRFSIGTDIINVIVETSPDGCIDFPIIHAIDRFAWHMANVEGVRDVMSLAGVS